MLYCALYKHDPLLDQHLVSFPSNFASECCHTGGRVRTIVSNRTAKNGQWSVLLGLQSVVQSYVRLGVGVTDVAPGKSVEACIVVRKGNCGEVAGS